MEFRLLGPLEVETDGQALTPTRPRERAVLALLLLRSGRVIGADELIDGVWGEEPPVTARTALQGIVSSLRRRLGSERIETRSPGYRFVLRPGDRYDVAAFEELVGDAAGEGPARRSQLLREALELFRGEPLADVALALPEEGARFQERRLGAEEALMAAELELGRHLEAIPRLERLVAEHPLREELRGQLMVALYRAGRQADALRVAQDARRVLASELGVEPGPALQRLELDILEQDAALMEASGTLPVPTGQGVQTAIGAGLATFLAVDEPQLHPSVRQLLLATAARHGGVELHSARGVVVGFARARDAAVAAAAIQRSARRSGPGPRIGVSSGAGRALAAAESVSEAADGALRLATVAHPGQVVLSREARDLLREAPLHEVDVRDLGEHRLADLAPAQPLYQLVAIGLEVDFPPTSGLETRPTNLPVQPTRLIGRQEEVAALVELLRDDAVRLVTLTGPGGTGKTRLAVHAAAELLEDAPDGAWFVGLDALVDPSLVAPMIATTMGLGQTAGGSPVASLVEELRERRTLIVLDNFEHILPAAGTVAGLLASTPRLKVLVTSRVALKLRDERVVSVPPLPMPPPELPSDIDELLGIGSVALFVARARAARPEFALTRDNAQAVTALCRALDGLPLAIELAASQIGLMSPAALLDRLDRALRRVSRTRGAEPERHRALQVTIGWSHDLLEGDARRLFAELAVFAGGWTLEAAESVCGQGRDVIAGMAALVDHSLVRVNGTDADPRFGMLETIRQYAEVRLDASGLRLDAEGRHARFFEALAVAAEPHLRGNPGTWIARLESEHDNLRAALDRLTNRDDAAAEAGLAGTLWRFWYLAGHLDEGRRRLEHAVEAHREPTPARAKALIGAAVMAVNTMDPGVARERAEEAIDLCRALDDAWGVAYAQFILGAALNALGDAHGARSSEEESLRAFRGLGDDHSALLVSRNLAGTLEVLGDRNGAEALYRENLRRARAGMNGRLEASTLGALATIAFDDGRVADASLMLRESLRLHRELADRLDTSVDLGRAAQLLAMSGQAEAAARIVGALDVIRDQLGARGRRVASMADATLASLRRQVAGDVLQDSIRDGEGLRLEEAIEVALEALS